MAQATYRPCALQNADKTYSDGTVYVYPSIIRFVPKMDPQGPQRVEIKVDAVTGQQKAKTNPMLRIAAAGSAVVLRFLNLTERDEISAAIVTALEQQTLAEAQPATAPQSAAPAAAGQQAAAGSGPGRAGAGAGAQSVSQFAPRVPPEQRSYLLSTKSGLMEQYQALVGDQKALTEDEFWSSSAMLQLAGVVGEPVSIPRASKKGMANRIVDLAKQSVGQDGKLTSLTISAEDEAQMLAEKPALRQLFDAQVPNIMSRGEFWGRYFKYYMAKRNKRIGGANRFKALQQSIAEDSAAAVADMTGRENEDMSYEVAAMFSNLEAAIGMDDSSRKSMQRRLNPVVDLAAAAEDRLTADGYGLAHNSARSEVEQVQGYSALSQQLVQDYNIHAAAVIGRTPAAPAGPAWPSSSRAAAAAAAGQPGTLVASEMSDEDLQRFRQQAGSGLEDLAAPVQQQYEELRVTNPRLYFSNIQQQQQQQGSQPSQAADFVVKQEGQRQQPQQPQDVVRLLQEVDPNALTERPMESAVASKVLVELCGGDVADVTRLGGTVKLSPRYRDITQQQTMLVDELLRHLWGLLPCNTTEKIHKMERIQQALTQRRQALKDMENECPPQDKVLLSRVLRPLWAQLDEAAIVYRNVQKALSAKTGQKRKQAQ